VTATTEHDAQEVTMPGWGGARPGAGRPAGSGEDLVDLDTQVRRDQLDWLDRIKEVAGDRSRAVTVRRMLDQARRADAVRSAIAAAGGPESVNAQHVLDILDGKDTITAAE